MQDLITHHAQTGTKFTDNELLRLPATKRAEAITFAEDYLRSYTGTFSFLVDAKRFVTSGSTKPLSPAQARGVLNCLVAQAKREPTPTISGSTIYRPRVQTKPVADGRYTVVLADGERRTIRLKAGGFTDGTPVTWVSFLNGPDNDSDYATCGYILNGELRWTKAYSLQAKDNDYLAAAVLTLVCSENTQEYAKNYALQSGNCARCNRTLTVPGSVEIGYGPDCAAILGIEWIEEGRKALPVA